MLQTIAWPGFLIALVVFGLAPGVLLRLIVLCYPRDHARRRELLAELRAVPRIERPFWVLEQLELAIFEGLWPRVRRAVESKILRRRVRHRSHPAEIMAAAASAVSSASATITVRVSDVVHTADSATVAIDPPPLPESL